MVVSSLSTVMLAYRRPLAFVLHAALGGLVFCAAFLLRFDGVVPPAVLLTLWRTLPLAMAIRMLVFGAFRLHRGLWRFASLHDLARLIEANTATTALLAAAVWLLFGFEGFPRSIFLIDWTLAIVVFGGKRFAVRLLRERREGRCAPESEADAVRTVIAGAGEAGVIALRELRRSGARPHSVIGFLDDAPAKRHMSVHGVPVMGTLVDAPSIVRRHGVAELVVAMPSAPKKVVRDLIDRCAGSAVTLRILPAVADAMSSRLEALPLREVHLDDLLGRHPIRLDRSPVEAAITGKRVLVTGAAGSIGSEIARQVAAMKPAHLALLDMAESPLFEIERALADAAPDVPRTAMVGDVRLAERMRRLMRHCRPDCVFHAAAYKHVPMMQAHPLEAIENNALGTWNTAVAAQAAGASRFILISTDKAVMPANVMGATKRMAEMLVSSLNGNGTAFMAVRFGNVLGSNGSVVPIFRRQIAEGGPVTVTHPEMTRYFMTIPEAVELVLQAGAVGAGGEMFLLDMGEPVRIVDMAHNLIRLSGLKPGRDIDIVFTGLRPGEKLTEELSAYREVSKPTGIPHLNRLADHAAAFEGDDVRGALETLRAAVARDDEAAALRALWMAVAGREHRREVSADGTFDRAGDHTHTSLATQPRRSVTEALRSSGDGIMTKARYLAAATAILGLASGCGSFRASAPGREARPRWSDQALAEMAAIEKAAGPRQQPPSGHVSPACASARGEPMIQAGHVLLVRVLSHNRTEIREDALRVSETGHVTLPLLGDVKVAGCTREMAKALLGALYTEYIRDPAAMVDFAGAANGREPGSPWGYVTVLGCVKQPGNVNIPATGNLTVTAAIQECGGLAVGARHAEVQVVQHAEDGRSETLRVDLHKIDQNGRPAGEIPLRNGDVVFVPEGLF